MKVYKVPLRIEPQPEGGFTVTMPALRGVVAAVTYCEAAAKLRRLGCEEVRRLAPPLGQSHDRRVDHAVGLGATRTEGGHAAHCRTRVGDGAAWPPLGDTGRGRSGEHP